MMWNKVISATLTNVCTFTVVTLVVSSSTFASSRSPRLWEELTITADFIGIVGCITPGNGIPKFSVVDAWKRPLKDTKNSLALVDWTHSAEKMFQAGEKFLVFGYRPAIYGEWMYTSDGSQGRRWRQGEPFADYLITVARKIPLNDRSPRIRIGRRDTDLATFKKDVRNFLRQTPEFQELAILRAYSTDIRIDAYEVDEAQSVREFLDALMDYVAETPNAAGKARGVLEKGGMSLTMAYLDGKRTKLIPFDVSGVKPRIRRRLKLAPLRVRAAR